MNLKELAWAAGFFDGEGHVGARFSHSTARRKTQNIPSIRMEVGQTDRRPLDRFANAVECGSVTGPYVRGNKPVWHWQSGSFEKVQAVIAKLWPFLSQPKRDQASETLKKIATARANLQPTANRFGV